MGKQVKRLQKNSKIQHPVFDWKLMKGMRNIIVHEYFGINSEKVFDTDFNDIPLLLENTNTALKELDI